MCLDRTSAASSTYSSCFGSSRHHHRLPLRYQERGYSLFLHWLVQRLHLVQEYRSYRDCLAFRAACGRSCLVWRLVRPLGRSLLVLLGAVALLCSVLRYSTHCRFVFLLRRRRYWSDCSRGRQSVPVCPRIEQQMCSSCAW